MASVPEALVSCLQFLTCTCEYMDYINPPTSDWQAATNPCIPPPTIYPLQYVQGDHHRCHWNRYLHHFSLLQSLSGCIAQPILNPCFPAGFAAYLAALANPSISYITLLLRRELPSWANLPSNASEKSKTIIIKDFIQYPEDVISQIANHDSCIWALRRPPLVFPRST